jgi:hypothetical protein
MIFFTLSAYIFHIMGATLGFFSRFTFFFNLLFIYFMMSILWVSGNQLVDPSFLVGWYPVYGACGVIIGMVMGWMAGVPNLFKHPLSRLAEIGLVFVLAINTGIWLFVLSYASFINNNFPWTIMIAFGIHIVGTAMVAILLMIVKTFTNSQKHKDSMYYPLIYWFIMGLAYIALYLLQLSPSLSIATADVNFTGAVVSIMAVFTITLIFQRTYTNMKGDGQLKLWGIFLDTEDDQESTETPAVKGQ